MKRIDEPYQVVLEGIRRIPRIRTAYEIESMVESHDAWGRRQAELRFVRKQHDQMGCLILVILFVTIVGILLYFLLPKRAHAAGHILLVDGGDHTYIAATMVDDEIAQLIFDRFLLTDVPTA